MPDTERTLIVGIRFAHINLRAVEPADREMGRGIMKQAGSAFMERVGIYEAKAKLSELIERVERGEEVTITKNRKPVAKIVPARAGAEVDQVHRRAVMRDLREFAKTVKLPRRLSVREIKRLAREGAA